MLNQKLEKETHTFHKKRPTVPVFECLFKREEGEKVPKTAGRDMDQFITFQYFASLAFT